MPSELDVLKLVCKSLDFANISYMLTGSCASNFYAVPRMTRDIDIVIEVMKLHTDRFFRIFKDDFYIDKNAIAEAIEHEGMFNIIHNDSVFKIDFIIRKDSSYRHTEFQRRQQVLLDDTPVWIVSPEDLILSKLSWAKESLSKTQLNDINNLFRSVTYLDMDYLHKWLKILGLDDIYQKVKSDA